MGYLKESELSNFTFINKLQFSNSKKKRKKENLSLQISFTPSTRHILSFIRQIFIVFPFCVWPRVSLGDLVVEEDSLCA